MRIDCLIRTKRFSLHICYFVLSILNGHRAAFKSMPFKEKIYLGIGFFSSLNHAVENRNPRIPQTIAPNC